MVTYEDFQQRITRAKEAARLASLAATVRGPPPLPPPPPSNLHLDLRLPSPAMHLRPPPPAFFHHAPPPPGVLGHALHPPPPPHIQAAQAQTQSQAQAQAQNVVPDDVRHRIDRLVEFIQRNGVAFEDTVRQRECDNPHFEFLNPGARFHDYFMWKKRQVCGGGGAPTPLLPPPPPFAAAVGGVRGPAQFTPLPSPAAMRPPVAPPAPPTLTADTLLSAMSTGALANVCKLARKNGLTPYTPIPQEMLWNTAALPPVEPARLEIRIAEFYQHSTSSAK